MHDGLVGGTERVGDDRHPDTALRELRRFRKKLIAGNEVGIRSQHLRPGLAEETLQTEQGVLARLPHPRLVVNDLRSPWNKLAEAVREMLFPTLRLKRHQFAERRLLQCSAPLRRDLRDILSSGTIMKKGRTK